MTVERALYFGCLDGAGHYLHDGRGHRTCFDPKDYDASIPWTIAHMDSGLLKNGEHPDVYDGKVFWTCGGRSVFWFAFFWWDNSVDDRGASNSGFYVRGFHIDDHKRPQIALDFACKAWPQVVSRQRQPLVLQS